MTAVEPAAALAIRGLVYSDDSEPGYSRRRSGKGFVYRTAKGEVIRDPETIARLRSLVVPPAWTDVWLSSDPAGHIQATGRDAKGRKQYRYHSDWTSARDESNFESLATFGHQLPRLRERIESDMAQRALSRERVIATTVWLLDHTLIRIGNAEYSKDSYGLTTLLDEHVEVGSASLRFRFVGKSGSAHDVSVRDRRVARIIRTCQELPGQHLLQYLDGDRICGIGSRDVNDYLRDAIEGSFTAKTFRTWGGSRFALEYLAGLERPDNMTQATRAIREAIKVTAAQLRNTPAVCRRSYVHPVVLERFASGELCLDHRRRGSRTHLADAERRLLALLDHE